MALSQYAQIEIGLHRSQAEFYDLELRITDPEFESEIAPFRGRAYLELDSLRANLHWPERYGEELTKQIFSDEGVRAFYEKNRVSFDSRGLNLRLRILIGLGAPELHSVRWELLRDPDGDVPLARSERVLVSRFLLSRDWRAVKLRAKAALKGLIAVAAPSDLAAYDLAEIDHAGEVRCAKEGLAGIAAEHIDANEPVTLDCLIDRLRPGVDILYLVCHGSLPRNKEPYLFLQDQSGQTAPTLARELADRIQELQDPPRLIVLASCESATKEDGTLAQFALAPRLSDAGVPAVVAMQGQISMETVKEAMPVFFRELARDGQIDRAMAVARGRVRERPDHWMPALFLRLKSGRIWYEPGFGAEGRNDDVPWDSVCRSAINGDLVPILGPDFGEHIYGTSRGLAADLALANGLTLSPHERPDAARIAQRIATKSGSSDLRDQIREIYRKKLLARAQAQPHAAEMEQQELLEFVADELRKDPDDPYRILSEVLKDVKVYVNGAADPLLKTVVKRSGRRPLEMFSDWRTECIVDEPRLHEAAEELYGALAGAAGNSAQEVIDRWRDGLRRPNETATPVSLEAAADLLEEMKLPALAAMLRKKTEADVDAAAVELLLLANELKLLAGERGLDGVETKGDKLMLHRRGDFIQLGGKFPRLTKTEPLAVLKEIKRLLLSL